MSLPNKRSVRVTGLASPLTLYGSFTSPAETALVDRWLSVVDFWTLGLPQTKAETAVEFLYRCLYGKKLVQSSIASASQAEQLNVGHQREGNNSIMVIADLRGLPGVSAGELPGNRYDFWRNTVAVFASPVTAQQTINQFMGQINAEPNIAPDDQAYLRGLILIKTLAQNFLITAVSGNQATGPMTLQQIQQFRNLTAISDYRGLAQLVSTVLPAVGINNW
jgi:hypothetical protein